MADLEAMLTGGHPNSLGRTEEVVDLVLADRSRFDDLLACYASDDEVVRLRVSSALKRVTAARPEWTTERMDLLQSEVAEIDQASTRWTLALVFDLVRDRLSNRQRDRAVEILRQNLSTGTDWIVLNNTMKVLGRWAADDEGLAGWLVPHAERLAADQRRSVAKNARSLLDQFGSR